MTFPKARLIVSACLFLAWIGFLGFLVYERNLIFLSRPQFAVAQAFAVVEIRDDQGQAQPQVTVKEIAWCADKADETLKTLSLPELLSCSKAQGYRGAGVYVIPLMKRNTFFQIAPVQTPGYPRPYSHATVRIFDAGNHPEPVLERLIQYAREKPQYAEGLLEPLAVPIVECIFARVLFPQVQPRIQMPFIELSRRLPIDDADLLQRELQGLKAKVQLRKEELRIYPATPQTRAQMDEIVATKKGDLR